MGNPNIKPRWKPGESGNPKGRPKGTRSIPDMLRRFGEYTTPEALTAKLRTMFPELGKAPIPLQDALWLSTYLHAIKGESWAFHLIADRLEGKPNQHITTEDKGGKTVIKIGGMDITERFGMLPPAEAPMVEDKTDTETESTGADG